MTRISIALGLGVAWALAACGGHDEAEEAAKRAREAKEVTEVIVDSARQPGAETGRAAEEDTQVTVESAGTGKEPAEE